MDSWRPRLLQKSKISVLWMLPFMSAMMIIWLPSACHVDTAAPKSWRNAAHGGQGSPWPREVGLMLGADAVGLVERRVAGLVGTNNTCSDSSLTR